jgi:3-methyladenine DNA glycosylase/8-oxoguanine DNA glycosylase
MLRFLRQHSLPGIEAVDECSYRRTVHVGGATGFIEVELDDGQPRLHVKVNLSRVDSLVQVAQRVRDLFDLDADPARTNAYGMPNRRSGILGTDPSQRVPGAWDAFELAVSAILGPPSGRLARATSARLICNFGKPIETATAGLTHLFPAPEVLAKADLASLGISRSKADRIRFLAAGLCDDQQAESSSRNRSSMLDRILSVEGLSKETSEYVASRVRNQLEITWLAAPPGQ